tara:strand:+ start:2167 stop:2769 length:603 start_codon:yes stop_codon:yes gene_type:complete
MATKVASLLTLMGGGVWVMDSDKPVVYVNQDNNLMSSWPSESISGTTLPPDCNFWNQSAVFSSEMCSLFVVNRAAASYQTASNRALRCAASYGVECVLSPEIGLAMPAAFMYDHESSAMRMLIAPKIIPSDSNLSHVRVSPPDSDGITQTRTMVMNSTLSVEYLDGKTKQLRSVVLTGEEAFCVQLLRHSFEPSCWKALD